jgi:hypothetical protein
VGDHPGAAFGVKRLVISKGMKVVRRVACDEFGDIEILGLDGHLSSPECVRGHAA